MRNAIRSADLMFPLAMSVALGMLAYATDCLGNQSSMSRAEMAVTWGASDSAGKYSMSCGAYNGYSSECTTQSSVDMKSRCVQCTKAATQVEYIDTAGATATNKHWMSDENAAQDCGTKDFGECTALTTCTITLNSVQKCSKPNKVIQQPAGGGGSGGS